MSHVGLAELMRTFAFRVQNVQVHESRFTVSRLIKSVLVQYPT